MPSDSPEPPSYPRPWGEKWRHSSWFITVVVTYGISVDMIACSIIVPVLPYRLQDLGYSDVSSLTAWLLLAYSVGMVVCAFPVAYYFHKYPHRRWPLIVAVIGMILATILFMLGRPFWTMVVARALVGIFSAVIWTVGFALLCENVRPRHVGRQLGFVMSGMSVGQSIAPFIGGLLYTHIGWHAPFVFCIIILFIDLLLRLCILERSDIRKFHEKRLGLPAGALKPKLVNGEIVMSDHPAMQDARFTELSKTEIEEVHGVVQLKPWEVLGALIKSPRGLTALLVMSVYGVIGGAVGSTLPLRVQEVWNKESDFVGLIFHLFSTCAMTPSGLEATRVARNIEGVSEIRPRLKVDDFTDGNERARSKALETSFRRGQSQASLARHRLDYDFSVGQQTRCLSARLLSRRSHTNLALSFATIILLNVMNAGAKGSGLLTAAESYPFPSTPHAGLKKKLEDLA
ncbi:hypothetical protein B9479_003092 [Cryptococcus floricola]|uniref:Major facilitator superfamily (MFS) profile domain-containing protein n=1 Tax=Cryptococcus floricola TaxID=2591691 RepID=A0A5D3AXQ8_9TREE|nr:hypothetical protein B9479_003092 [Cryptococcus floricola]